jgi:hypothetical protein
MDSTVPDNRLSNIVRRSRSHYSRRRLFNSIRMWLSLPRFDVRQWHAYIVCSESLRQAVDFDV